MKRGLVLISVLLLLAAPMASAGSFGDFFEKLMDRSASSITGYATIPSLSTLLKTPASTATPSNALPAVPKTTALALPKTPSLVKPTIAPIVKTAPIKALAKPNESIKKISINKKGLFLLDLKRTLSITSTSKDGSESNAKLELKLNPTDSETVMYIGEQMYKVVRQGTKYIFTPTAQATPASLKTDIAKPAVIPTIAKPSVAATKTAAAKASAASTTPATTAPKTATQTIALSKLLLGGPQ